MKTDKYETKLYDFWMQSDYIFQDFADILNSGTCNTEMLIEFYYISIKNNELDTALWVLQYINIDKESTLLIPHENYDYKKQSDWEKLLSKVLNSTNIQYLAYEQLKKIESFTHTRYCSNKKLADLVNKEFERRNKTHHVNFYLNDRDFDSCFSEDEKLILSMSNI